MPPPAPSTRPHLLVAALHFLSATRYRASAIATPTIKELTDNIDIANVGNIVLARGQRSDRWRQVNGPGKPRAPHKMTTPSSGSTGGISTATDTTSRPEPRMAERQMNPYCSQLPNVTARPPGSAAAGVAFLLRRKVASVTTLQQFFRREPVNALSLGWSRDLLQIQFQDRVWIGGACGHFFC
jgi:hypothetical protein